MKKRETYFCEKCDKVMIVESVEELKKELENHNKDCDGTIRLAGGNCIQTSFKNLIDHPDWKFCYAYVKPESKDFKYIHAWNEVEGYIKEEDGKKVIEVKNIEGKELETFVFDFSGNRKKAMEKEKFYDHYNITEEDVKKLDLRQVLRLSLDCLENGDDAVYWCS